MPESDFFFCEKLSCALSSDACGKRWQLSKSTPAYLSCKGCPVGKGNAVLLPTTSLRKVYK